MKKPYHNTEMRRNFYTREFGRQEGRCAICGQRERLVVDHNHKNGQMRGLLCYTHNAGLGMFGDDVALLTRAIEYLEQEPPMVELAEAPKQVDVIAEFITTLLSDPSFNSDRARAREVQYKFGLSASAAQSRVQRLRHSLT